MTNDNAKPRTIWIQRNGYSIELTEDEIRAAYAACTPINSAQNVVPERVSNARAVSDMTSDIMRLMDDIAYVTKRYEPEPSVFGTR